MNDAEDGKPTSGTPAGSRLPVVWSPKLDAGEGVAEDFPPSGGEHAASSSTDEAVKEAAGKTTAESAAPASSSPPSRFMLLAASVAIAAAVGALFGSLSASGFAYFMSGPMAKVHVADARTLQVVPSLKAELADLASLKANLDNATRSANGQFAKLADRLDRVERAEAEPAAKISHIADAVDRLEKRSAAAAAVPEITGSIAANRQPQRPRDAADGKRDEAARPRAAGLDRAGRPRQPRAGREPLRRHVCGRCRRLSSRSRPRRDDQTRQDGRWVVVTARGVITSER